MADNTTQEPHPADSPTPQQLAGHLRLLEIRTLRSRVAFFFNKPPINIEQRINVQAHPRADISQLVVLIQFVISGELEPAPGDQEFALEATFGLSYHVDDINALDQAFAQQFAQQGALFQIWPYWREFVHSSSTRAGLPPLNIPTITPGGLQSIQFAPAVLNEGSPSGRRKKGKGKQKKDGGTKKKKKRK